MGIASTTGAPLPHAAVLGLVLHRNPDLIRRPGLYTPFQRCLAKGRGRSEPRTN